MLKNYRPLAMMAADTDDLKVASSLLQDAVAKVRDMAFLPTERRFAMVANRFVWEEGASRKRGPFHRVRSGLHFDDVTRVRTRALDLSKKEAVVSVLSVEADLGEDGVGVLTIHLGGGGAIALEVEAINLTVKDLSEPWTTKNKPDHLLDA